MAVSKSYLAGWKRKKTLVSINITESKGKLLSEFHIWFAVKSQKCGRMTKFLYFI
jgi:hypothetical protein